jgi:hypothetical protein
MCDSLSIKAVNTVKAQEIVQEKRYQLKDHDFAFGDACYSSY